MNLKAYAFAWLMKSAAKVSNDMLFGDVTSCALNSKSCVVKPYWRPRGFSKWVISRVIVP